MAKNRSEGANLEIPGAAKEGKGSGSAAGAPKRQTSARGGTSDTAGTARAAGTAKGAAGKTGTTAKPAGARRGGAASAGAGAQKTAGGKKGADLRKDLRAFASTRPQGWSHDDWLIFLDDLQSRGHNINDRDSIGSMLERERLTLALEKIPGVGPQRVRTIAERYGYLWRLKETDADQLSREADVPKAVAEKVVDSLRA